jgi:hypothetical protein
MDQDRVGQVEVVDLIRRLGRSRNGGNQEEQGNQKGF